MTGVLRATRIHATKLGMYVAIYKLLVVLQRRMAGRTKMTPLDAGLAGMVGGAIAFGDHDNAISQQVRAVFEGQTR